MKDEEKIISIIASINDGNVINKWIGTEVV